MSDPTSHDVAHLPGPAAFVASFLVYVVAGLVVKSVVLNWIVGPLWLLVTLFLVPAVGRAVLGRSRVRAP